MTPIHERFMRAVAAALAVLVTLGCSSHASTGGTTSSSASAGSGGSSVDRGPTRIAIDGDPNGIQWDASTSRLLVADDDGNRILAWTDAGGFANVSDLPSPSPEGAGLGHVVQTSDGTIVVTRFGYGTTGDVAFVPASGAPSIVPGLDPERRRIGLTTAPNGRLFDSWFLKVGSGRVGSVGQLSLGGTETEVITGLKKPVGVVVAGDSLFVSDQDLGQILKAPIATPAAYSVFATVDGPDLLAAGPDGSIFSGSLSGDVYRVDATGAVSVFQSGFLSTRGVAYDAANHRLFVAEHDTDASDGVEHALHILPVD